MLSSHVRWTKARVLSASSVIAGGSDGDAEAGAQLEQLLGGERGVRDPLERAAVAAVQERGLAPDERRVALRAARRGLREERLLGAREQALGRERDHPAVG